MRLFYGLIMFLGVFAVIIPSFAATNDACTQEPVTCRATSVNGLCMECTVRKPGTPLIYTRSACSTFKTEIDKQREAEEKARKACLRDSE